MDALDHALKVFAIEKDTNASKGTEPFKKRKVSPTSSEQTA